MTKPGKPAPEPTSQIVSFLFSFFFTIVVIKERIFAESAKCLFQICGIVLFPIILDFSLKEIILSSYLISFVNVSRETSNNLEKVFFSELIFNYFLTYLNKMLAAAGVMPGNCLASSILFGLFFDKISLISLDSPSHSLKFMFL